MIRRLFIVIALAWSLPLVSRADVGAMEGTIRDAKTNQPVANAQVKLKMGSAGKQTVMTDQAGRFQFNAVPTGSGFNLQVLKPGYEEWSGPCPTINGGNRIKKDISISPAGASGGMAPAGGGGSGGGNGTVSGIVTAGGQPLAGAAIKIGKEKAVTAANGTYSIKLPPGEYQVEAKKEGYKKFEGSVTVKPGTGASLNIQLNVKK